MKTADGGRGRDDVVDDDGQVRWTWEDYAAYELTKTLWGYGDVDYDDPEGVEDLIHVLAMEARFGPVRRKALRFPDAQERKVREARKRRKAAAPCPHTRRAPS